MKRFFASLLAMILPLSLFGAAPLPMKMPARDLRTLSIHDLMTLPASTKVSLGKATITVGRLRANHNALAASRQRVKTTNVATLRDFTHGDYRFTKTFGGVIRPGHVTPINLVSPATISSFATRFPQTCACTIRRVLRGTRKTETATIRRLIR